MGFIDLNQDDLNKKLYINPDKFVKKGIFMIYTDSCPYCIKMLSLVNNDIKFPVYGYNISRNHFTKTMFKLKPKENGVPLFLPVSMRKKVLISKPKLIGFQTKKELINYLKKN